MRKMRSKRKRERETDVIECDFHGLTTGEAEESLLRILDEHEGRRGLEIDIIHGKGTGILASAVERIASSDPRVDSCERRILNPGVTSIVLNGRRRDKRSPRVRGNWDSVPIPAVRRRKR
jgi:DNA-nicking Smr family endonuclease